MLNVATPILQIKSKGIDLYNIRSMTIIIQSLNVTITKNNDDIEVDGNLILVFLTQLEASSLNSGEFNISILAIDINGNNVSDKIKMIWAKRSSISSTKNSDTPSNENLIWYPMVSDEGIISWQKSDSDAPPESKNIKGENGFSPTITENPENSDTVYKLDIVTVDSRFTTPNLKGGQGGGSVFEVEKWYQTSGGDFFTEISDGTWKAFTNAVAQGGSWSIYSSKEIDVSIGYSRVEGACYNLILNNEIIANFSGTTAEKGNYSAKLIRGVNTLFAQAWKYSTSYAGTPALSIMLPPIVY